MKKIALLISLFLLLLFSSCRNLINTNTPETDRKTIIVTGYINYSETPERTAVPTIPSTGITYNVYAKKANSNETSEGVVDGNVFSIKVNKGTWTITVDGSSEGKVILSSSWTKTFKSDDDKITNYFTLHPLTTETGNIDLSITIDPNIKNFSKLIIESVNPAWEKTEYTIPQTLNISNNSINIKKDSIPAGYYPLDFLFYDSTDSLVYTTTQLVDVFNNLTTNKWQNNSSSDILYLGSLRITPSMVNNTIQTYYYVDGQNGDDSGNGNATLPFKTLSKAIEHVTSKKISNPTIYIAGTVAETNPITVTNRLTLRKTPGASTAKIVLEKDLDKSLFTQQTREAIYIYDIEIDGNNHTVQGNGGCFNITTVGSFYLYGTTISNFKATGNGGGIYSTIKVTLDENTTVKNCEAKNGGGIYSSNKEINLSGSFINNKAEKGSGIYVDQAITFNNNLTIDTTNDIYLAKGTSIAVSTNSYPNIQKVIVTPAADFPSGATVLYAQSTTTANSLKNKFVLAMPDSYEYVNSSSTSAYFKRKIYVSGADSTVLPEGSDENNGTKENPYATVSGAREACGGAFDEINIDGTVSEKRTILIEKDQHVTIQKYAEAQTALIVRDTEFNDSSMINSAGVLTLTNLTLDGNEVDTTVDGAGIKIGSGTSNNRSKLTLENTVIKNCYTNKNGGAIYNYYETYSTDLYLTDTEITNSKANDGAGIYTDKYLHISGSTLFNKNCNIYLADSSRIFIDEELTKNFFTLIKCSKYENNKIVLSGTEALLNSNHTKFELSKNEFYSLRTDGKMYNAIHVSDNGSDTTGDGKYRNHVKTIKKALEIAADSKAEIMLYDSLQLNEAANIVGDISFTTANSSECTITRGNFDTSLSMFTVQNAAKLSLSNKITLDGTSVKLTTNGGAINCRSGGTVSNSAKEVKNFNVDSTGSYKGGAIYCGPNSTIGSSASYTNNSARLGGAMYIDDSATVSISGGTFTGNSAVTGSAIYDNGNVSVYGGTITTGQNFYLCTNRTIETYSLTNVFTEDLIIQNPPTTNTGTKVLTGTNSNLYNNYQKFGIKAESYQLYKNGYACLYTLTASSEDTLTTIVETCKNRGQTDFKINLDACTKWPVKEGEDYLYIPSDYNVEITASAPITFKPENLSGGLFKAAKNATLKITNIKIDASQTRNDIVIYMGSNNIDKPTGTIILGAGTEIYNGGSTRIIGTIYIASGTLITEPGCKITNNTRAVLIDGDSAKFIYRGGDISGNSEFDVKVSSKDLFINESGSAGPNVTVK